MEMLQLKYFMHVARTENISHTASIFMVPPSGVSATIKKLEKELGVKLFDRTANTLKLNEYGRIFLSALERAENELKKSKIDMMNLNSRLTGELNFLIMTNRGIVTKAIREFSLKYPSVTLNMRHSEQGDYPGRNRYDIIVSDKDMKSDVFSGRLFVHDEIFLAVHKDNPLSRLQHVNIKNITGEKFISMPKSSSMGEYMDRVLKENDVRPEVIIECDDPYYVREYVKMGLGITFYPRVSWGDNTDGNIRLVRINNGIYRDSYIYLNNQSGDAAKIFAEMLEIYKMGV